MELPRLIGEGGGPFGTEHDMGYSKRGERIRGKRWRGGEA
jgi:hypothetical protein